MSRRCCELVDELNQKTRFIARRLRVSGDVSGADSVLCWQTGFPFGVDLSRGYPRFNPGEFTCEELLERGEIDACVIVGSRNLPTLSDAALEFLASVPLVVLDSPNTPPSIVAPAVQFATAVYGIHAAGTAYRMDEVPIPLRKLIESPYPTDAEVLQGIAAKLKSSDQAGPLPRRAKPKLCGQLFRLERRGRRCRRGTDRSLRLHADPPREGGHTKRGHSCGVTACHPSRRFDVAAIRGLTPPARLAADHFVHAVAGLFEFSLTAELLPDFFGELVGRGDGDDAGAAAAGHGAVADFGFVVEAGELHPLLEGLVGLFEFFLGEGFAGRRLVGHGW